MDPLSCVLFNVLVLSALWAVKVPTGEYRNVDGLIPVGEGQWDFDLGLSAGRSFWPRALYINADLGLASVAQNAAVDRDPGDEWFCSGGGGWASGVSPAYDGQVRDAARRPCPRIWRTCRIALRSSAFAMPALWSTLIWTSARRLKSARRAYFPGRAQLSCGHAVDCCADSRLAHYRIGQLMRIG